MRFSPEEIENIHGGNGQILPKYHLILPKYRLILPKYRLILPKFFCFSSEEVVSEVSEWIRVIGGVRGIRVDQRCQRYQSVSEWIGTIRMKQSDRSDGCEVSVGSRYQRIVVFLSKHLLQSNL